MSRKTKAQGVKSSNVRTRKRGKMYKTEFEFYAMCMEKKYFDLGSAEQYSTCGKIFECCSKTKHDTNGLWLSDTSLHELSAMVWICSSSLDSTLDIYNNILKIL